MTKPQKLPVEEARKKFADLLDGSQFRNEAAEITRRGKPAGYLVPPDWYVAAVAAVAEVKALRKEVAELRADKPATKDPSPSVAAPRTQVTQAIPAPAKPGPESVPLSTEEAQRLVALGRSRADSEQRERLRRVATTAKSLGRDVDIALLDDMFAMGLLTDADVQR